MEKQDLQTLSSKELLSKYKRIVRNAPSVMFSSNEELDKYYEQVLEIEGEIARRMGA